jgi:hypothetical protein
MSLAERYRKHADECVSMAHWINDRADKAVLLQMAQAWRRLAGRAEAHQGSPDQRRGD